jgi:hypothetical protein
MMPTTEIELNEVAQVEVASPASPVKRVGAGLAKAGTVTKKKIDAVYGDVRNSIKQTSFTPVALRPVDRTVIIFL